MAYLINNGHEAVYWLSVGEAEADDGQIIEYARANGIVVLTGDVGFTDGILRSQEQFPSVVLLRARNMLPRVIGALVTAEIDRFKTQLEAGAMLSVDEIRGRVRVLPLD